MTRGSRKVASPARVGYALCSRSRASIRLSATLNTFFERPPVFVRKSMPYSIRTWACSCATRSNENASVLPVACSNAAASGLSAARGAPPL